MDQTSKWNFSSENGGSGRYDRQLPIFGEAGQRRLAETSVFIAGTGGLGSPVATYLAAVGVGRIVLMDCDRVEVTNLNRQFLHHTSDIGRKKAESGRDKLKSFNSEIEVAAVCEKLMRENVAELVGDCRIIVDALDNNETRRILAEYAITTKRPYFHAAVSGYSGQFASFYPEEGPCYFCVFSETEEEKNITFPIIGATAGIVGSMQANEIIKYITDTGSRHVGKLFIWDGLTDTLDMIETERNDKCPFCRGLSTAKKK